MKSIKILAVALVAMLALSCNAQKSNVKVDVELPSAAQVDSVSYLIGVNFGAFLKNNGFAKSLSEVNMSEMKKGMVDFLKAEGSTYDPAFGEQFEIDPNTMNVVLSNFLAQKQAYEAAVNKEEGKAFLAKNAKRADVDTTASGLQYTIIAAGAGEKIAPQDTVWVNYKGTLIDGTVFDEHHSEEGIEFVANRVIPGWTEGLGLVGEGGKLTLYIPSELAYGERGQSAIAPNSVLLFDVEVIKVGKFAPKAN